jgi:hypothetical protein
MLPRSGLVVLVGQARDAVALAPAAALLHLR